MSTTIVPLTSTSDMLGLNSAAAKTEIDLAGFTFNILQTAANAGDTLDLRFKVQNSGLNAATPFSVRVVLSKNINFVDGLDLVSNAVLVNGLAGKTISEEFVFTYDLPDINDAFWTGDGSYFLGLVVDSENVISEVNEANNSGTLQFNGQAGDYDVVQINNTQRPDLSGKSIDVTPEPIEAGNIIKTQFAVQNTGGGAAGAFQVAFYLSKDATISTADRLLATTNINGLAGLTSTGLLSIDLQLPGINNDFWIGDGTYYVGMIVDSTNVITESNGDNNSNLGLLIDSDDVVINRTQFAPTEERDVFSGSPGDDFLRGSRDDDDLLGLAGNDTLRGDRGDDDLLGGMGNDAVQGGQGDDFIWGVNPSAANPGRGEIDILIGDFVGRGSFGADIFVLGNNTQAYYNDGVATTNGSSDYALIRDFSKEKDTLELHGSVSDYQLATPPSALPSGTALVFRGELIAIVQGDTNLNLNANYFTYV